MARQGTNGQNGSGGAALARSTGNSAFALTSFLDGGNAAYAEQLYENYRRDPNSVDPQWQSFFAELKDDPALIEKSVQGPAWKAEIAPPARDDTLSALDGHWDAAESALGAKLRTVHKDAGHSDAELRQATRDSVRAIMMIRAYRMRGHLEADLDPLGLQARSDNEALHPSHFGFTEADYARQIFIDGVLGLKFATIPEMLAILRRTYCGTIGYEFMHISDPAEKSWLQARIEGLGKEISFTREGKRAILNKLAEADGFEKFLDLKFTGTKRFGLDGGESMIPALEQVIKRGGALGVTEIVLGMAHRGRLNVLSQVMAKPHRAIFHEFKGGSFTPYEVEGSGDVKYHLGASSDRDFDGNHVHLSLTANPSHLEIVDPVVLGKVRAKQDQQHDYVERSESAAAAHPWRRGLRRPGRHRRMFRPFGPEGPPHRRFGAFHHQQPDRLHHLSALFALLALSVGCGEDDRGADLPCEWRRSRSRGPCRQGRRRIPPDVPQACGHRHVLLPPLRP